jgi:PAS domain S-box-containing protein
VTDTPQPDLRQRHDGIWFRLIADTLPAYVAYIDEHLNYVVANRMYQRQFGLPAEAFHDQPVAKVLGTSFENVRHHLEAALRGEPQHFETRMHSVEGDRYLSVTHLPDYDPDGHIRGLIIHGTDITERRRMEDTLKLSENALIQSEKLAAVGKLAASISHEINNPLEAVTNLLYLARQDAALTAETRGYLDLADRELARVSQVASHTLRFHRQSTRALTIAPETLLAEVLTLYSARLLNFGVRVHENYARSCTLTCYESEIRQVLNNLVGNAIEAMRTGGDLYLRSQPATHWTTGRPGIRITVGDTGSGMSLETQDHIFEAFYTTKGINGTGLGLWISRRIAHKHRGLLRVRSAENRGTVFSLWLPLALEASADIPWHAEIT